MKIAISVPDEVFEAGEHLAKQLGLSRSQLYADALSAYLQRTGGCGRNREAQRGLYEGVVKADLPAFDRLQLTRLANEAW